MRDAGPTPDFAVDLLAAVLAIASERNQLVETDRLLREVVGSDTVQAAHCVWTARMREGLTNIETLRRAS